MNKQIIRYSFVFVVAVTAVYISYNLNNKAFVNRQEFYCVMKGDYPERLKNTPGFKKSVEEQIETAAKSGAHLKITSSFKNSVNHPHLFMKKLLDLAYWHTSISEKIKFRDNSCTVNLTCGANKQFQMAFTMRKIQNIYFLETITGLDAALINASRAFALRPVYNVNAITFPPLAYDDAFNYWDSSAVLTGILSGEYDTSIHQSVTFKVEPKPLALPPVVYHNAVEHIRAERDYWYKLIPVAHHTSQLSDSLDRENFDTIVQRLMRLEYGGSCVEHALIVKRALQEKFTVATFTLKKDSHQLIDHMLDLVYYSYAGVEYGVTVDALLGIIGPVKSNGGFYSLKELQSIEPFLNYPAERKSKRYTIDTLLTFSNVFMQRVTELYADNGFIYYQGYDDFPILTPKELMKDKMPRKQFDEKYAHVLAAILLHHIPKDIKNY